MDEANLQGAFLHSVNLENTNCQLADFKGADLTLANISNVNWGGKLGNYPAILPDGTKWHLGQSIERFVLPFHPEYISTRERIHIIRKELGYETLS